MFDYNCLCVQTRNIGSAFKQNNLFECRIISILNDILTFIDFLNICCAKITVYSISQRTKDCALPAQKDRMTVQPLFLPNINTSQLGTEINCQHVLSHKDQNAIALHMMIYTKAHLG